MVEQLSQQSEMSRGSLVTRLRNGSVLGICGSGLSVPLGYPTWHRLITLMIDHLEATSYGKNEDLRYASSDPQVNLPNLAQAVKGRFLDQSSYYDFLKGVFLPLADIDLSSELEHVARIPVRLWMTTNYDHCLAEALRSYLDQSIESLQTIPLQECLQPAHEAKPLPKLVYLHGHVREPQGIVLTNDDYQDHYLKTSQHTHAWHATAPFSLFFVGYGLQDKELKTCLEKNKVLLGTNNGSHFALMPAPPDTNPAILNLELMDLRSKGIEPIFYPVENQSHAARCDVLKSILADLGISMPKERKEITIGWREDPTSSQVRQWLADLKAQVNPGSPLILRELHWDRRTAIISTRLKKDIDKVNRAVRKSNRWTLGPGSLKPPIENEKDVQLRRRSGVPFQPRKTQIESSPIVSQDNFRDNSTPDSVEEELSKEDARLATAHAMALGLLDSSAVESNQFLDPLIPSRLSFGQADCFHPNLDWRLDSPVINVWIYTTRNTSESSEEIVAITAIGTGLPEIRETLEAAAFTASMSLPALDKNLILTRGLIHLSVSHEDEVPQVRTGFFRNLFGLVFGGTSSGNVNRFRLTNDTSSAMLQLRSIVTSLAEETGFVQVHTVPYDDLQKYVGFLRGKLVKLLDDKSPEVPVVLPRSPQRVVTLFPLPGFPYLDHPKISLRLSGDWLETAELKALLDAYHHSRIVKMVADIDRRIEFWKSELKQDREKVRWFKSLSPEERRKIPDVRTGRIILTKLGINVKAEESLVPAEEFYLDRIPRFHIPEAENELKELEAFRTRIMRISEEPFSALWRACLARVFDCAIRQVRLCDDDWINDLFERWRTRAAGVFRHEWDRILASKKLHTDDVFKRITFFDVEFDENANVISVFPNLIIDSSRATVVISKARGTLIVRDILDEASNQAIAEELSHDAVRSKLIDVVDSSSTDEELNLKLRSTMWETPGLAKIICDASLMREYSDFAFDELRQEVNELARRANAGRRALTWMNYFAFNSAIESLEPENELNPPPGKALAIAFVNCFRHHLPPIETLKRLMKNPRDEAPSDIRGPFSHALLHGREQVERFLRDFTLSQDEVELSPAHQIAWDIERFFESVELAEKFRRAAASLDPRGESIASTLLKSEKAFEAALGSIYVERVLTIDHIIPVLTGEPLKAGEETDNL